MLVKDLTLIEENSDGTTTKACPECKHRFLITEGQVAVTHTCTKPPAPQPTWCWEQKEYDALISFLKVNFKLHRRRLTGDSDAGHYLTNLAAMNAFHDVLEFLKKAPKLPA